MEKYSTVKVNNRILELMSTLSFIKEKVDELVTSPKEETALEIEGLFEKYESDTQALRSSVVVLARSITGTDIDTDGSQEFDVMPDKNGLKMN